jgi:hypothetical protein
MKFSDIATSFDVVLLEVDRHAQAVNLAEKDLETKRASYNQAVERAKLISAELQSFLSPFAPPSPMHVRG